MGRRDVKRRGSSPPHPPKSVKPSTVRRGRLARGPRRPAPPIAAPRPRSVGHIVDEGQASVLDLIDNLLNKGVMLNADLVLALANVDLVYVRLSALLCAADRVLAPKK
jgi:hypothetical protein